MFQGHIFQLLTDVKKLRCGIKIIQKFGSKLYHFLELLLFLGPHVLNDVVNKVCGSAKCWKTEFQLTIVVTRIRARETHASH